MPTNPIDTWQEELDLLVDGPTNLKNVSLYYLNMMFLTFVSFLATPVGQAVTVVFLLFLIWQFRRVALRPLSPGEKLLRRTGLVLLALAYMGVPLAAFAWMNGWLTTWIFVLPPAVLLIAALYMLFIPTGKEKEV